jgi:HAMP domain-containing protein/signal transduction histidine kinase/DNA-binding response OmpR family regulator
MKMARVAQGSASVDLPRFLSALKAVRQGDFSVRLPDHWTGVAGKVADTFNEVVEMNQRLASELERLHLAIGRHGKITERASVGPVSGAWADSVANVNSLVASLVQPTSEAARVIGAVAKGDLSQSMALEADDHPLEGEFLRTAKTVNLMVEQLRSFAAEVTRVAREVGTEGKLGGQADVRDVAGTWKDLTDSVNSMAGNLTAQVRNIAEVTTAVATGDLSRKITVDVRGEVLELKNTINTMVDQLRSFAAEVTRVAREVGTEGKLGGQARVEGVSGTWRDLTDSVNSMAGNLTAQVRNIAEVTTAVANGDLSRKITVDVKGEILELKNTVNTMVDQLSSFAAEVTRVAREVGTEGKLGGQADVRDVAGTWKDLTDSVNSMAGNLTSQVRNIADVTKAVANGDLGKKITVNVRGEILELKNTINTMVDQLSSFAAEVTRVAREVGTEGKLGGQADVRGVAGTWKDLTDSVNSMAGNLTDQVRNIAEVTTAVANGDLSRKITVDVRGEILELKDTVNRMVDQLRSFAAEVTRVAREVGTEGKLGGQADVKDVAGTWKDLTDSVNSMAGNLTAQVRNIADVTKAVAAGDLSRKITVDVRGEILDLKDTVNRMVDQLRSFAAEVTRVAREVGTEGKLGGQADVKEVAGTWKDLTDNVNSMASNLTAQVRNIADVTKAVAAGDLSRKISVDVRGEILDVKDTVNRMVDQLRSFAAEVTRVAREVGTEGKLGGQADVKDVAGTWKDLTDNVNSMASNLTGQVRGIARVVTAVANGDLRRKLTLEAKGEIAELADTINSMIDTLATFADQVTTVAREVGVEGKLGGQARVPGAAGTWKDLTDNVNQLAANLTTQVRAIAEVATAVTKGDLTRAIAVEARGEVAVLKDTTNEMIRNLRETTLKNSEQDWLKTNLAKFSRMLQGQKDLLEVGRLILSELGPVVSAHRGAFYILDASDEQQRLKLLAGYALEAGAPVTFRIGEGLVGQCAREKRGILLDNVPANYVRITSGLGGATPASLIILPVLFEGDVKGVIELASFDRFNPTHKAFLDLLVESIGIVINTIEANMRTEALLAQSQSLASELGQTNQELQEKAQLLAHQNAEVERKNQEVEQARQALEEKAAQLALTSKYKSEFLANMSHELRTPLNSLLILSDQLSKNPDGNLSARQTEFAKTIHSSGNDLLNLINDILDLSKIESGTVVVDVGEMWFADLHGFVERTFNHLAEAKGLEFGIQLHPDLPRSMHTDAKRLQQILKNLLSNAFKFTRHGRVDLTIGLAAATTLEHTVLAGRGPVIAFSVADSGIGIPPEKQQIIFEAFQQADGSTSRTYGGTGLGLAISRELSHLLGGEIHLMSTQGHGSTFTLYLPTAYTPPATPRRPTAAEVDGAAQVPATRVPVAAVLAEAATATAAEEESDDRRAIQPGDRVLLIVENDSAFARALLDEAHAQGFKGVITSFGAAALGLSNEFQPVAITLDISLPDIHGYWVLERIKNDMATRHIPVYVITTDDDTERGLRLGARMVITKPLATGEALEQTIAAIKRHVDAASRELLIVEPSTLRREQLVELLDGPDVSVTAVGSGAEASTAIEQRRPDCLVLNPRLPDAAAIDVAKRLQTSNGAGAVSVLVHGDGDMEDQVDAIRRVAPGLTVKDVRTEQRLLDQTALYLHRRFGDLSAAQRRILSDLHGGSRALGGKKALVVDDDIRNIFALTSVLEEHHMLVVSAENGQDAIKTLQAYPDVDVVLMDIMMPQMDGMETTRQIRLDPRFRHVPIIAVTAKAMKGDREKCIEAGAWDYLAKPVDPEELVAMLRAWLVR